MSFNISIPAKCILAGEHLVIERGFALVTPFDKLTLNLTYTPNNIFTKNTISTWGNHALGIILWPVVQRACQLLEKDPSQLTGTFVIDSQIPPGSGLGFSAALCVAVTEWTIALGFQARSNLFAFATELENTFHIKSSGADVAGVMSKNVIQFFANKEIVDIRPSWQPMFYVTHSLEKSITFLCVEKVQNLRKSDPIKADAIYDKMSLATELIKLALESSNEKTRLNLLAQGMQLGNECYYDWDLMTPGLHQHIKELEKYTLACKVIGAGLGGHVLSLWDKPPPKDFPFPAYPVNIKI
jgi:mevalonate kinase